jgi:phage repressor protein C with HTH and peptisase S24 domain
MDMKAVEVAALDLAAIGVRVRQLLNAAELDGTEFALQVGVPYGTMRAYITGQRPPSAEFLAGCYRAFGFMPAWLLTGEGPMRKGGAAVPDAPGDIVVIPRLDLHASAGPGSLAEPEAEYRVGALCVTRAWLLQRRLSPANLRAISVRGTSMQPVLFDGDLVVVDIGDRSPRTGFVYVLRHGDELLVKYCEQLPGGLLRISSANPSFQPYEVDLARSNDVGIVGRVVASMHDW